MYLLPCTGCIIFILSSAARSVFGSCHFVLKQSNCNMSHKALPSNWINLFDCTNTSSYLLKHNLKKTLHNFKRRNNSLQIFDFKISSFYFCCVNELRELKDRWFMSPIKTKHEQSFAMRLHSEIWLLTTLCPAIFSTNGTIKISFSNVYNLQCAY